MSTDVENSAAAAAAPARADEPVNANLGPESPRRTTLAKAVAAVLAACLVVLVYVVTPSRNNTNEDIPIVDQCVQVPSITPNVSGIESYKRFTTPEYENRSIELLAGAVRIPTVSYDDMLFNVTEEPRFEIFKELHSYLFTSFPLLAKHVEFVNTYGLLYTIKGKNESLKPLVLTAHQDVVPVAPESINDWYYDPFSAHFDGDLLYGRGTSDTKNLLVAIHEAVEALLEQDFVPERTVLLSFGFDEEIQGFRGARKLAEVIEERYGEVEMLVDEGNGIDEQYGALFAAPAVAEKGRVNFRTTLYTKGGHSSAPPDHTGIGIMAELIVRLESQAPFEPKLPEVVKDNGICLGVHAPTHEKHDHKKHKKHGKHGHKKNGHEKHKHSFERDEKEEMMLETMLEVFSKREEPFEELPKKLRYILTHLNAPGKAGAKAVQEYTELLAATIGDRVTVETTQAIDIIRGGIKVNALPEQVVMEVNYRVNPTSSVEKETEQFFSVLKGVAHDFGLSVNYTNTVGGDTEQYVVVKPPSHLLSNQTGGAFLVEKTDSLEVAPVAPYDPRSPQWRLLAGTALHAIEKTLEGKPVFVAPGLMTGNTDTAHYWNVTHNLYRFIPALNGDMQNIHTVNEALRPRSHISTVAFIYELIANLNVLN